MKIAVIGSGVSGLVATYFLAKKYDVTLFEKDDWVGGHTHTVSVNTKDGRHMIDTGFIVCNPKRYPNFIRLMQELKVELQATNMSFSVTAGKLQYNGTSLSGLFAQRSNLFNPRFYSLLNQIIKFNNAAKRFISGEVRVDISMQEFLSVNEISSECIRNYVLPILSAIWSNDLNSVEKMPAHFVCKFFNNHGLFDLINRPQWYVVKGGSKTYVDAILSLTKAKVLKSTKVFNLVNNINSVDVRYNNGSESFDRVIVAAHSDQALRMLSKPTDMEREILAKIKYFSNEVVLHTDTSLLPTNRRAWAAWNYTVSDDASISAQVTYNMNILQSLQTAETYCVSLNQTSKIDPDKTLRKFNYAHPMYDNECLKAQQDFAKISGLNRVYYCGAYWGYGFHEDGVNSALRVVNQIDKDILCKMPYTQDM